MPKSDARLKIEGLVREGRVSYPAAIALLKKHNGDVVDALMDSCDSQPILAPKRPDSNDQTWKRGCSI